MKKILAALLCLCLALSALSACKKESSRDKYKNLSQAVISLVDKYNEVAQLAKDNGWEADFDTLKMMNDMADQIDSISAVVTDPAGAEDAKLDELKDTAEALLKKLNEEILPRVQQVYASN